MRPANKFENKSRPTLIIMSHSDLYFDDSRATSAAVSCIEGMLILYVVVVLGWGCAVLAGGAIGYLIFCVRGDASVEEYFAAFLMMCLGSILGTVYWLEILRFLYWLISSCFFRG